MRRYSVILAAVLVFAGAAYAAGPDAGLVRPIKKALGKSCVNRGQTAVRVVALPSGREVYDFNGGRPLLPASVHKIIVTSASLHYLGPDYRFKTWILHTGELRDGVIHGDLVVKGGGDPKLVPEQVWLIAEAVRRAGVKKVTGSLVADASFFDGLEKAPSWGDKYSQRAYDARLSALSVNFNSVALHVRPGSREGAPLVAGLFPQSPYLRLVNRGVTSGKGKKGVRASRVTKNGNVIVTLAGALRPGADEEVIYMNVDDPLAFAAETFREYFRRSGVEIAGKAVSGRAPEDARELYTHESAPLAVILRDLNKYSNNFIAEQTAKTIAAEISGPPGTHGEALRLLREFLERTGVPLEGVTLADASGLSRKNRLTARFVTGLLAHMKDRFDIGPDFMAALGIMGVDGNVKDRLEASPARSFARAKTGSLSRLSALAGYVAGPGGGMYAYSVLLNDTDCYYLEADRIEDAIVTSIYSNGAAR